MYIKIKPTGIIQGRLGVYLRTLHPSVITYQIAHGRSSKGWFVEFAIPSKDGWRRTTIYDSDTTNEERWLYSCWYKTISDQKNNLLHIKVKSINANGSDVKLWVEFDDTLKDGFIIKRKKIIRMTCGTGYIFDEYKDNAEKYYGTWG
jgi:hypothetical protein